MQAIRTGKIPAHQGNRRKTAKAGERGQIRHALEQPVRQVFVSVRRERDRGRKANGNSPHPGQIAQVHGQRLPADILGREIRAPEMRSLHEQIGAHAQQAVPVQHGTVVPPAETHAGTRGRFRKKMINAGQHMVFGSKRRAHTAP